MAYFAWITSARLHYAEVSLYRLIRLDMSRIIRSPSRTSLLRDAKNSADAVHVGNCVDQGCQTCSPQAPLGTWLLAFPTAGRVQLDSTVPDSRAVFPWQSSPRPTLRTHERALISVVGDRRSPEFFNVVVSGPRSSKKICRHLTEDSP